MVDLVTGIIFPPPVIGECDLQQFHSWTTLDLILFGCLFALFSIITVTLSVSLSILHSLEALWMSSLIL
jgi:hypothetical protein